MKTRKILGYILVLILITSFLGCEKDYLPGALNEIIFDCPQESTSDFYLEADMGEEHFCYYEGVDGYEIETSVTTTLVTSGPNLQVSPDSIGSEGVLSSSVRTNFGFRSKATVETGYGGRAFPHLKHWLFIESPSNSSETQKADMVRKHITKMGDLPLESDIVSAFDGFNINFSFNNLDKGRTEIFVSSGGNQDDSFLRISELDIQEYPSGITQYNVTFEFECNLYYYGKPNQFYKRLNNGIMKIQFEI